MRKRRASNFYYHSVIESFAETGGKGIHLRFKDCQKSKWEIILRSDKHGNTTSFRPDTDKRL